MAEGKDIAWLQYAYIGGALIGGIALGTFVVAPAWKKFQDKKKAKKTTGKAAEAKK